MPTPAAHPKLLERVLPWSALACAGFVAVASCGLAFFFPLELEYRESSSWLHVLAAQAGISIYDHQQVAFVNMNHGPLDPIVKHWLAATLPFLSPAMVTRCFVLLLPAGLCWAMVRAGAVARRNAVLWGAGLYVFLLGIQPPNFLIGRSDPAALFLLALLLGTAAAWNQPAALRRQRMLGGALTGFAGMLVLLTNWRFFPMVGAVIGAFTMERWLAAGPGRRWPDLALHLGCAALGALVPVLLLLGTVFDWNLTLYHRHFFGFFMAASGWGAHAKGAFELFPPGLVLAHRPLHLLLLAALVLAWFFPSEKMPRRVQLLAWLPLLALLWLSTSAAYYINRSGGGLWYFGACYVVLAFYLLRATGWERIHPPWGCGLLCAGLFCTLPWPAVLRQIGLFTDSFAPAQAFLHESRARAGGAAILSEDYFFFKERYAGEVVDTGDQVFIISATRYYGDDMTVTADRYFAHLRAHPPQFVIAGICSSPVLSEMLARDYKPVLRISPETIPYAGTPQTFYERKPDAPR